MTNSPDALDADLAFFAALLANDAAALQGLLADDFVLIDVMAGSEVPRPAFVSLIASGQLRFESIDPDEVRVRLYDKTAVVTGRTKMRGRFGDQSFTASSRYTHVYVQQQNQWRIAAAQGTQIPQA